MKCKSALYNQPRRATSRSLMGLFGWLAWLVHQVIDSLVDLIFKILYHWNWKKIAPIRDSFLAESATSLADKIRKKELSSEKLVESCINRIREVNDDLNFIADARFEEALEEAREVDRSLSTSVNMKMLQEKKPFLGVPFTSKETTNAKNMSNTYGLQSRKNSKSEEDAVVVARMKESGAILLAVTNTPVLNMWQETRNSLYGQTNNPYDVNRTVGGSSGGEGAAIASCASPLGIGTDIGGSIRMPSYFCGIFGHKPTPELISTKGLVWRTGEEDIPSMLTAGTMTRYARDIIPFLKVLLGDNVSKLKLDTKVNIQKVGICYVEEPGDWRVSPISKELKGIMRRTVSYLEEKTSSPAKQLNLPGFHYCYLLWRYWMHKEPDNFAFDLGNREYEVSLLLELLKFPVGKSVCPLPALLELIVTKTEPAVSAKWAEEQTESLRSTLIDELGPNGVLLFPSYPTPANHHYVAFFRPYNFVYWGIFNALHFPATQVPLGLSNNGLPIGLQVVAAPYNDHLCIAVAQELERGFGGFVPPCPINQ